VEARGRDRGGMNLGEDNATRGSAAGPPGKTGVGGTDPAGASILAAATSGRRVGHWTTKRPSGERQGGQVGRRRRARYRWGKPSEGEKPADGSGTQQGRKVTGGIKASRG